MNNTDITALFAKYCDTNTATKQNVIEDRIVNGQRYFFSQYSKTWQKHEDRCGKGKHRYTRDEIRIWTQIYKLKDKVAIQIAELQRDNKLDEAKQVKAEFDALWLAKDRDASLYAKVAGLTTAELDKLEAEAKKQKAKS